MPRNSRAEQVVTGLNSEDLRSVLAGIARGDETAFNRFYDAYYDRLFRFLMARLKCDEEMVHDVLQRVMLRIVRHVKPVDSEGQLWNWLRLACRSGIADACRERKQTPTLSLDDDDWLTTKRDEKEERPLRDALDTALSELAPAELQVIEMAYFKGNTHAEIAAQSGCTAKAIEMRIARIRTKLKRFIARIVGNE